MLVLVLGTLREGKEGCTVMRHGLAKGFADAHDDGREDVLEA